MSVYACALLGSHKLVQEACVVLREHTEVSNAIFEVCDALDAKTECVAGVNLAVDAASLEHIGVYHATAKNLNPACVLAETAALAAADVARDVHLGTWLGEGEVARTQTYLCVWAEQLTCEG